MNHPRVAVIVVDWNRPVEAMPLIAPQATLDR